jgi:RNAse (barnase) inhibitor barstar
VSDADFWAIGGHPIVVAPDGQHVELAVTLRPGGLVAVARFDGAELHDENDVFAGFYQAFQFPEWFGWNSDALSDCLRDLHWLPADRFLVVIDRADQALTIDAEERRLLIRVLRRAAQSWASPMNDRRPAPIAFRVIFRCPEEAVARLREEIAAA